MKLSSGSPRVRRIGLLALCVLSMLLVGVAAAAGKQDFTLHNETGKTIQELYVSPNAADNWQEDVLGEDTLETGNHVDVKFARAEKADVWDLRVVFEDGKAVVWTKIKLSEITDVTISFKGGKPFATTKNGG